MAKFNKPLLPRVPDTRTAEGGVGFSRDPKDELFTFGLANLVGENTFYETGASRDDRFEKLIHQVTQADEQWVKRFIGWLRSEGNMRSAPLVAAAEYLRAGGSGGRQVVASVLQRPDEPAELIGYWHQKYGRNLPMPLKRGIADSLSRLYTERNVLRYDGQAKAIRFGDVVELTHPKPADDHQAALYRHLIDRRHGRPNLFAPRYRREGGDFVPEPMLRILHQDAYLQQVPEHQRRLHLAEAIDCGWSWERLSGWLPGGMDTEAWTAVAANMGLMALTRNLRNFDQVGVSDRFVTGRFLDPEEVRKSRQFPLRFLTAWKAVSSLRWGNALEGALNLSLGNVPAFPGRTLVLVDVSPSMRDLTLSRRTDGHQNPAVTPYRWETAGVFGAALAQRAEQADVFLFDWTVMARAKVHRGDSVLRFVEQCGEFANRSNGTDILRALAETWDRHDRVVILTDEQQGYQPGRISWNYWDDGCPKERYGWNDVAHIKVPVFTWNIGGHRVGVTPNERNWHTFGGLSDAAFLVMPLIEKWKYKKLWPWEVESGEVSSAQPA
jgi:hypothetical protein